MQDLQPTLRRRVSPKLAIASSRRRICDRRDAATAPRGFTLTELLIVIAIIAVLAALITAAARNALVAANRGRIVLEIKNMSGAVEDVKNSYGAYPPNSVNDAVNNSDTMNQAANDMVRMFKKAFPRLHSEEEKVVRALAGQNMTSSTISANAQLTGGLRADEALVFWLGGFSDDAQFPISGAGGPSFDVNSNDLEVLENRKWRYQFELGNLGPRDDDGLYGVESQSGATLTNPSQPQFGRAIAYQITMNGTQTNRRINLWTYRPKNSDKPYVYFDVSRKKPYQYDPPAELPPGGSEPGESVVYALKRIREGRSAATASSMRDLAFVNFGKFQILHAGLDGDWGEFGPSASNTSTTPAQISPFLYPTGPYIGAIADTLTNFADGELADEQENE